jgi:HAD superfamily phosphatase (TIGR01668 family)
MIKAIIFDYGRTLVGPETDDLFPEAKEILDRLTKRKLKLALVSRSHHLQNRRRNIKRLQLKRYFETIEVIPAENTKEYAHILKRLRVKAEECLVIGDQIKGDILPGNKMGAATIWLKRGKSAGELPTSKEEEPDHTITSLEELLPLIDSMRTESEFSG